MLYYAFQSFADLSEPMKAAARMGTAALSGPWASLGETVMGRNLSASYQLVSRIGLTQTRPSYQIDSVLVGNEEVPVVEEAALELPFGTLLHFRKDMAAPQPRVLVVAPLSGHFATLLRNTVKTLLADHDVYITDWVNARDVSLDHGAFGFDDYVEYLMLFMRHLGPGVHMVAVCQPCVQALIATAIMAEDDDPAQPRSITLMAGPIDTRVNPTKVNDLAKGKPISWFERNLIARVPLRYKGAMRKVYPGFLQLTAFVSMNLDRHVKAHVDLQRAIADGDTVKAETTKNFYDEYFAVLDLAAEFYLETVRLVFQEHALPLGAITWKGRKVDPKAIRRTMLFTVEGERDDICAVGQTLAAHDLCTSLRPYRKRHHLQAGVGHYGVFSGKKWDGQIYPQVRNVILASD
jgi:poly(3-hydroxybutyrate) depolymerase